MRRLLLSALSLFFISCSGDGIVGGDCRDDEDCSFDSYCERGKDYPGGVCTMRCRDDRDCPFEALCIDKSGGICLLECRDDRDCRPGYDCKWKDREGERGDATVCIGD